MELQEIITQLKDKFGDKVDVSRVTEIFKNHDTGKMSFSDIIAKVKEHGIVGDLDGDGKKESLIDELKGKFFGK